MKAKLLTIATALASAGLFSGYASLTLVPAATSPQSPSVASSSPFDRLQVAGTKEDIRDNRVPPDPPDGDKDKK